MADIAASVLAKLRNKAKGFEEISLQRKYHGISTQIIAQIKNVRVPFNVDIGVGDIIVPPCRRTHNQYSASRF